MVSGRQRNRRESAAMRASATTEGNVRLAGAFRAGKTALGGRDGMISRSKARMAQPIRLNQRARPQKNVHVSGRRRGRALNLRIQDRVKHKI